MVEYRFLARGFYGRIIEAGEVADIPADVVPGPHMVRTDGLVGDTSLLAEPLSVPGAAGGFGASDDYVPPAPTFRMRPVAAPLPPPVSGTDALAAMGIDVARNAADSDTPAG